MTTMTSDEARTALVAEQAVLAALEAEFSGNQGSISLDQMIELTGKIAASRTKSRDLAVSANKEFVDAELENLRTQVNTIVGASKWFEYTGQPITALVYTVKPGEGENGPVIELAINPTGRKASTGKSKGSSNGRTKSGYGSSKTVQREVDGVVEAMTVKEMIVKYADDDVRDGSLYAKSAWSGLFNRVNKALTPQFELAPEVATEENTAPNA